MRENLAAQKYVRLQYRPVSSPTVVYTCPLVTAYASPCPIEALYSPFLTHA